MTPLTFKPPKDMRAGQAIYAFTYWLQDTKQLDLFYLPNHVILAFYQEWLNTLKK